MGAGRAAVAGSGAGAGRGERPGGSGLRGRLARPRPGETRQCRSRHERRDHQDLHPLGQLRWGGMLSFQVAFPDEETDFSGSPFNPRLGDSKVRYRFAPFQAGRAAISYFIEGTAPTADPAALGTGKYQLSAGVSAAVERGGRRFTSQLQQVNSVAGDEARADINYTKLDLSLRNAWRENWVKLAVNTRADWELGKTGAVGEVEYGRRLDPQWSLWLLAGHLLWGEGVKATYGSKLMIGLDRWF